MSENVKIDRRIRRTKNSLQDALKKLMEQKPYAKIKVSEIVELADVARPTFYMHYETKDDLLFSLFNGVFVGFKKKIDSEFSGEHLDPTELAIELFRYWDSHSETVKILLEAEIDLVMLDQIRQCTEVSLQRFVSMQLDPSDPIIPYLSDAFAGGFFMILKRWIGSGKTMPAEMLGAQFGQLLLMQADQSQPI